MGNTRKHQTITFRLRTDDLWHTVESIVRPLELKRSLTVEAPIREVRIGPITYMPDGPVIVAGIGALSATVAAVLTYFSKTKEAGRVVIKGKKGATIDVPKGTSRKDIDYYISKAKELDGYRFRDHDLSEIEVGASFPVHWSKRMSRKSRPALCGYSVSGHPGCCTKDPFWDGTGDHELPSWAIVVHAQQYM